MRVVLQRVRRADVTVEDTVVGEIGVGLVVLVGITPSDGEREIEWMAAKLAGLRVFEDEQQRLNRSVREVGGALLVVSNFTLYGCAAHGRRPEFTKAAPAAVAKPLFDRFVERLRAESLPVETGVFGADMQVQMQGDGPVTIWIDTAADMPQGRTV